MTPDPVVRRLNHVAAEFDLQVKTLLDAPHLARRTSARLLLCLILIFLALQPRAMARRSPSQGAMPSSHSVPPPDSLPNAPSASVGQIESKPPSTGFVPPTLYIQPERALISPRVIDRQFVTLNLLELGAVILDIESTQRGLARGAREGNPIVGSHPSRAVQYGFSMPVTFGLAYWSHYLKKNAPHSRRWQIIPLGMIGMHGTLAVHNFAVASGRQ